MAKYRKRPVVVDAWQFAGTFDSAEAIAKAANVALAHEVHFQTYEPIAYCSEWQTLRIDTLEGNMVASAGDYIIRGVKGELYPCRPDIFAATYEAAE